ncbi:MULTISPECIES: TetR/AcrR family transcriptional regulator [unclassified Prosthecochloris]|uniref:TetR/AcrR family transcriptional regulator n=1 Tax=unclassified Prosthecochloris TaxID=2632826 RepID=UPI00223D952F|nr:MULTISPECIES: TetR family transcriptional regulator [unclassified Prosthecochloris]UZJ38417.1 TetR family transcriptional regulator [Prosthecochloris sp. SCSIO W1103]
MKKYASSEQTRLTLINAAGELAAEMGFPNVSTRAIAMQANENIGSIHYHFGGKEQLFEAVVQEVVKRCNASPVSQAVEPFYNVLDTPAGQSGALRAIVKREITLLFDPDFPPWHSRVIYQLMQQKGRLQDIMTRDLFNPIVETIESLLKRIDSSLDREETFLIITQMISPIASHADYMSYCLDHLGTDHYSAGYLQKMEDMIVRKIELLLGLTSQKFKSTLEE